MDTAVAAVVKDVAEEVTSVPKLVQATGATRVVVDTNPLAEVQDSVVATFYDVIVSFIVLIIDRTIRGLSVFLGRGLLVFLWASFLDLGTGF